MTAQIDGHRCEACGYPQPGDSCDRCGGTIRRAVDGTPIKPGTGLFVADFIQGASMLVTATIALFTRKAYAGRLALAVAANLVVFVILLVGLAWPIWEFSVWLIGDNLGDGALQTTGEVATGLLSFLIAMVTLWLIGPTLFETVLSPFLDPLAAVTERLATGRESKAVDQGLLGGVMFSTKMAAKLLLIQLGLLIPLLLISLTGVGAIIAVFITAWLNALVWLDIPCSRRGYGLRERFALMKRNWARSLGFGLMFQAAVLVPVFNFLLLAPASAVAISALYLRFDKSGVPSTEPSDTIPPLPRNPSEPPNA